MWRYIIVVVTLCHVITNIEGRVSKRYYPSFANAIKATTVTSHYINEASGLCASRIHNNILYTNNDSGDTHRIYAFDSKTGNRKAIITLDAAHSRDWEDVACGPCAGGQGHCIYIADTGGNAGGDENTIYRIREPSNIVDQHVQLDGTLKFNWDQSDCETVMVDNHGEVYVVSKVHPGHHGKFVKLPSSEWNSGNRHYVNSGVNVAFTASSNSPVGGDISENGKEVLLKTYGHIYYWYIPNGDYYGHMTQQPIALPYHGEPQGESVCWDKEGSGYYTVSEGNYQPLWYYGRNGQKPT